MGWAGSIGGGDQSSWEQTLSLLMSPDSLDWAARSMDAAGVVGDALNNITGLDDSTLECYGL